MMVDIREDHDRGGRSPFSRVVRQVERRGRPEGDDGSIPRRAGELLQRQKCRGWRLRVQNQFLAQVIDCILGKRAGQIVHPSWRRNEAAPTKTTSSLQSNDGGDYKQRKKQQKEKEGE